MSLKHRKGILLGLAAFVFSGCIGLYPPSPGITDFSKYKYTCLGYAPKSNDGKTLQETLDAECSVPSDNMVSAMRCPKDTRNVFGGFLECREGEQIAFGASIAALAAGAAGVAGAGVSTAAATSLGGAAGAGIGLDYILYNKAKTKAYADAVAQLECIIATSAPLQNPAPQVKAFLTKDYSEKLFTLRNFENDFPRYLKTQRYPATKNDLRATAQANGAPPYFLAYLDLGLVGTKFETARQASCADATMDINLLVAQYKIAKYRAQEAERNLNALLTGIPMTTEVVSVRAFAASQAGVPDAETIEKAAQSAANAVPKPSSKGTAADVGCYNIVQKASEQIAVLNQALRGVDFPNPAFPECLVLKGYEEAGASDSSKGKKSSDEKSGKGSSSSADKGSPDDSTGGGKNSDSPAQPPTKIAFQILPRDEIAADSDTSRAILRIVGGKPPYFVETVDPGVEIRSASQTDLFVSFEVQRTATGNAEPRLLCADQAGSSEVVYILPPHPSTLIPRALHRQEHSTILPGAVADSTFAATERLRELKLAPIGGNEKQWRG